MSSKSTTTIIVPCTIKNCILGNQAHNYNNEVCMENPDSDVGLSSAEFGRAWPLNKQFLLEDQMFFSDTDAKIHDHPKKESSSQQAATSTPTNRPSEDSQSHQSETLSDEIQGFFSRWMTKDRFSLISGDPMMVFEEILGSPKFTKYYHRFSAAYGKLSILPNSIQISFMQDFIADANIEDFCHINILAKGYKQGASAKSLTNHDVIIQEIEDLKEDIKLCSTQMQDNNKTLTASMEGIRLATNDLAKVVSKQEAESKK